MDIRCQRIVTQILDEERWTAEAMASHDLCVNYADFVCENLMKRYPTMAETVSACIQGIGPDGGDLEPNNNWDEDAFEHHLDYLIFEVLIEFYYPTQTDNTDRYMNAIYELAMYIRGTA
jgi:hypothetical protein